MDEHLRLPPVDVLALDASFDTYHLRADGAAALANHLKDALLIPYHYGTFDAPEHSAHNGDPAPALARIKNSANRLRSLAPGEALTFSKS
jgi:L-ascorbate metabolism protein UlaG (beta-lactamase superfamily)